MSPPLNNTPLPQSFLIVVAIHQERMWIHAIIDLLTLHEDMVRQHSIKKSEDSEEDVYEDQKILTSPQSPSFMGGVNKVGVGYFKKLGGMAAGAAASGVAATAAAVSGNGNGNANLGSLKSEKKKYFEGDLSQYSLEFFETILTYNTIPNFYRLEVECEKFLSHLTLFYFILSTFVFLSLH
jgi:hypothetical protein